MPNPEIERLLANALQQGITHPGDKSRNIPAHQIGLPFKPSPGMAKEMSDLMDETTKQLAEAIVHLIETQGDTELVPRTEARSLRHAAGEDDLRGQQLPVYCRCDSSTPLMVLSIRDPGHVVIDGSSLLRQLHKREADHPHAVIT